MRERKEPRAEESASPPRRPPPNLPTMDDYIQYTIDTATGAIEQTWDFIASSSQTANLHELPAHLSSSIAEVWYRLSQHNTLPSLEWSDLPGVSTTPPPPPPPPPTVSSRIGDTIAAHPYLFTLATTSTLAGGTYYFFPAAFMARLLPVVRPLKPFVPLQLLPTTTRPLRITGPQGELRKEAVLVPGAEGLGREIALDLERRGYVVIATVRDPREVDVLERKSRGWMKVLVLDPTDVRAFWLSRGLQLIRFASAGLERRPLPSLAQHGALLAIPPPHLRRPLLSPLPFPRPHRARQLPLPSLSPRKPSSSRRN